jgi:hypothetical protein
VTRATRETYGRSAGEAREATESDFDAIFALNTVIMEMNRLAADPNVSKSGPSTLEYVAGLASRSGIDFTVPQSYMMVPFLYGHSLEQMADMYLGDAGVGTRSRRSTVCARPSSTRWGSSSHC